MTMSIAGQSPETRRASASVGLACSARSLFSVRLSDRPLPGWSHPGQRGMALAGIALMRAVVKRLSPNSPLHQLVRIMLCAIWIGLFGVSLWLAFKAHPLAGAGSLQSDSQRSPGSSVLIGNIRVALVVDGSAADSSQIRSWTTPSIYSSSASTFWFNLTVACVSLAGCLAQWTVSLRSTPANALAAARPG